VHLYNNNYDSNFKKMKNLKILIIGLILMFCETSYAQWTVKTVPNPRGKNSYVSNPDNILTKTEVSKIDSILQEIEDSSKAQVAVIMLQSIGTTVPKEFATELFNFWKIGTKEANNGLLVLFVNDQRRIEFETGYGIETILPDAKCYEIQQNYMVPRFKEGNYGQGMIDGIAATVEIIMGRYKEITTNETATTNTNTYSTQDYSTNSYNNYSYNTSYYSFLGFYIRTTIIMILIFIILFCITLFQKDFFDRYRTLRIFKLYVWFILFPIPFVGIYFLVKDLMDKWRNAPRISAKTGRVMHKLSETEDDQHLQAGQVTEEQIKSIDYDVWVSEEPGDVMILGYKRWFSKYSGCPKCKYKTYYKEYDRVLVSATYSSSGKGERKYKCMNCGHSKIETYTIPRKTKSSSSSSYSSSSYGSSSSSSFGGTRSWGGGSSGGGGAGSSW
jgi:uncharacterized protein